MMHITRYWITAAIVLAVVACSCGASRRGDRQPNNATNRPAKGATATTATTTAQGARPFNAGASKIDMAPLLAEIHRTYNSEAKTKRYSGKMMQYAKYGLLESRTRWFKTNKPVGRGSDGAYYYRFDLTVERFRDVAHANAALKRTINSYRRERQGDGKGNVSYTLAVRNRIYTLSTRCLMNRHLAKYYKLIEQTVLGGQKAEKGSMVEHHCGGGFTLR